MDLAQESSNPHREAILKRLEDRTRMVTESMIQKRKKMQMEEKKKDMRADFALRRSKSMGMGLLATDNSAAMGSHKHRRLKKRSSMGGGVLSNSVSEDSSFNSRKKKDPLSSHHRQKSKKSIKSEESVDSQKRSKSKSKQRRESKKGDKHHKSSGRKSDNELTPKSKNGKGQLGNFLDSNNASGPMGSHKSVGGGSSKKRHKSPKSTTLSSFLQSHEKEEDGDYDSKSMGAKSLPAHMESMFHRSAESERIASAFMFDDSDGFVEPTPEEDESEEDLGALPKDPPTNKQGEQKSARVMEADEKVSNVEQQIKILGVRRQALAQECEHVRESVSRKAEEAERSRDVLASLQDKLREIQSKIEKEQSALTLAETGIELQKETLALHEEKIKDVETEQMALEEERKHLVHERQQLIDAERNGFITPVPNKDM
mmetsp:Transcript_22932/g.53135  ORF Transcript_22932/g.53135 Transcript_22932/m.53135 type:complete len:429 (+) Transcript_22932:371-1657(+)